MFSKLLPCVEQTTLLVILIPATIFAFSILAMDIEIFHTAYAQVRSNSTFTEEPSVEQNFIWHGIISSKPSQAPEREDKHTVMILPPRKDAGMYSGVLTFQATRPVNVTLWNQIDLNGTSVSDVFGRTDNVVELQGRTIVLQEIVSGTSGSLPFVGNAIELIANDPFVATYGVNALTANRIVTDVSDIRSLTNSSTTNMSLTK